VLRQPDSYYFSRMKHLGFGIQPAVFQTYPPPSCRSWVKTAECAFAAKPADLPNYTSHSQSAQQTSHTGRSSVFAQHPLAQGF
jgi:hypothetical protein